LFQKWYFSLDTKIVFTSLAELTIVHNNGNHFLKN
jgi:hypothetical protein